MVPLSPVLILVLCVVAGIGTVLLLPSRREETLKKIGGVIVLAAFLILAAMLIHYVHGLKLGHMSVYFWLFSAVAILGAVRVIAHPRPVYAALYFVLSVMASAGLFILLWAEFMAAALVVIYAGAILVTYVFVIMLATQSARPGAPEGSEVGGLADYDAVSREPVVACAIGFTLMGVLLFVIFDRAPKGTEVVASIAGPTSAAAQPGYEPNSVQALGAYLFKSQLVNLELAGLILTIAMVGAILIARRRVVIPARPGGPAEVLLGPATPIDDNPHSIPVYGSDNPRVKAYPEA
ncbi:MAG TPA: NADH-quinone oxidoreductase subunit J [Tepidisphaeraceae bacterium]|jgi:NADH-quinone oxidoreductase subunit J